MITCVKFIFVSIISCVNAHTVSRIKLSFQLMILLFMRFLLMMLIELIYDVVDLYETNDVKIRTRRRGRSLWYKSVCFWSSYPHSPEYFEDCRHAVPSLSIHSQANQCQDIKLHDLLLSFLSFADGFHTWDLPNNLGTFTVYITARV